MPFMNLYSYIRSTMPDKVSVKIRDNHIIEFDFDYMDKVFNSLDEKCKAAYRPTFERARKKLEEALIEDLQLSKFLKKPLTDDTLHDIEEQIEFCDMNRIFHGKLSFKDIFILEFTYDRIQKETKD